MFERMARLEARLAKVETQIGLESAPAIAPAPVEPAAIPGNAVHPGIGHVEDELEQQVGQSGFAIAGISTLTIGAGYMLSLPYSRLPLAAPGLLGMALAGGLLAAAHVGRRGFGPLADYVRGAAMALLFLATLRLSFFGRQPAISLESFPGQALLVLIVGVNAAVAWRSRSRWLAALALLTGCGAILAVGTGGFLLIALPLLAAGVVLAARQRGWTALLLTGIPSLYVTYFFWAIGNPLGGGHFHYATEPPAAPAVLLVIAGTFAAAYLWRPNREHEDGATNTGALLNCLVGYPPFLVHSAAAYRQSFTLLHLTAFLIFLGVAVQFWVRERSRVSTFFYALTGYAALSMAILKAAPVPDVFVWLSGQSIVVVATAIWFRSRLIVVANFLIYAAMVLGYMFVADRETGISIGFGLVALVSARILNWQRDRLELKTELMRNAYLLSAFVVFPYALHHLVPLRFVALSWVGLAVAYYALNFAARSQKYRWMGHATLGLTAVFLLFAGSGRIEPVYRIASFLALGTVLMIVSLVFTHLQKHERGGA